MNKSFSNALEEQSVIAKLVDIDYHRNFAAFGSVETHYIIQVRPSTTSKKSSRFATFRYGSNNVFFFFHYSMYEVVCILVLLVQYLVFFPTSDLM